MDENQLRDVVRSTMQETLGDADRRSIYSRVSAIESSYARREELAELETRILKWIVASALTAGAVAAAIAAGIVSFVLHVIG